MNETKPKRRWFRFSLRTLFVLVTIVCVWLGCQMSVVHQRKRLLSQLNSAVDGFPTYETSIIKDQVWVLQGEVAMPIKYQLSWIRQAFGDKLVPVICLPTNMPCNMIDDFRKTFPESIISQMPTSISDEWYSRPAPGRHFEKLSDTQWTWK